jgi:membrane-anchored protein YejM (alkaline phosphatase superfamily)
MLDIWERFATKYARECHFGFTFLTALTHDNANNVELLDQNIYDGLIRMKYKGVFDHTAIIVMGDHGQRVAKIQQTYSGRIEERMPFFAIFFPEKFRIAYPKKFANFIENKVGLNIMEIYPIFYRIV